MFVILGLPGTGSCGVGRLDAARAAPCEIRTRTASSVTAKSAQPRLAEVFRALWASITYRHLLLCFSVLSFFSAGLAQWNPTFFIRSHGLQTGELGTWLAVIYGVCGTLGAFCGGALASLRSE